MAKIITKDHPAVTLSPHLQQAAQPIFDKFNLNYFQYLTVFKDGSFAHTNNHTKWTEFIIDYIEGMTDEPMVYSSINEDQLDKHTYSFLWDFNLPELPVGLAREHNICNGLTFVERFDTHYNMIGFASPRDNKNALDVYVNHKEELLTFIRNFQHDQKHLIQELHSRPIRIEPERWDQNLHKMLADVKKSPKMEVVHNGIQGYVTPQEFSCLKGISEGKTYKEVGLLYNISPRTVESYLKRVRDRFGINLKRELIGLYHKLCTAF